ncbi:MAG: alpha/beta fold hydrolase [Gammaproteobacteria bacterium]
MRRSRLSIVLIVLVTLVVALLAAGWWLAGGRATPLLSPPGLKLATALEMPGVHCDRMVIPARLSASGWFEYNVVGELCALGVSRGKTLQILLSGSGYGPVYWDFPYEPDTYSYNRAALRAGYATFNFYRLGMGESDRPLGLLLNVDNQAYVLEQVVDTLRHEHGFGKVVMVAHSFGSVIAIAHGLTWPASVDGIVLTGFAHNTNPGFVTAMRTGVDIAAIKGPFAGHIIDPTYMISKPGTRHQLFYNEANTDPTVIEVDEMNRQTTALGEVLSSAKYFGPQSKALTANVLQILGEDDFVVCGGALDCHDHDRTIAHEQAFFPAAASYEMVMLEHTGHDAALHRDAPTTTALILDWIARRIDGQAINGER